MALGRLRRCIARRVLARPAALRFVPVIAAAAAPVRRPLLSPLTVVPALIAPVVPALVAPVVPALVAPVVPSVVPPVVVAVVVAVVAPVVAPVVARPVVPIVAVARPVVPIAAVASTIVPATAVPATVPIIRVSPPVLLVAVLWVCAAAAAVPAALWWALLIAPALVVRFVAPHCDEARASHATRLAPRVVGTAPSERERGGSWLSTGPSQEGAAEALLPRPSG
jgi:hypothetical protein